MPVRAAPEVTRRQGAPAAALLSVALLVALLSSGCRIFGEGIPCDQTSGCPEQLPHCVAGVCAATTGDGGDGDSDGGVPDGLAHLSTEFDADLDLLAADGELSVLHPGRLHRAEIADGALTLVGENPPGGQNWAWFGDEYGGFVFHEVTGDVAVSTRLSVVDDDDTGAAPSGIYNIGGLMLRDPAGTHLGDEQYVQYSLGAQSMTAGYGRAALKTESSTSGLYANGQDVVPTGLLLCRVGDEVGFWWWDGSAWVAEVYSGGSTEQVEAPWPEIDTTQVSRIRFEQDGLPATVQVGVIGASWDTLVGDMSRTRAVFDHLRFARPGADLDSCPAAAGAP